MAPSGELTTQTPSAATATSVPRTPRSIGSSRALVAGSMPVSWPPSPSSTQIRSKPVASVRLLRRLADGDRRVDRARLEVHSRHVGLLARPDGTEPDTEALAESGVDVDGADDLVRLRIDAIDLAGVELDVDVAVVCGQPVRAARDVQRDEPGWCRRCCRGDRRRRRRGRRCRRDSRRRFGRRRRARRGRRRGLARSCGRRYVCVVGAAARGDADQHEHADRRACGC